MQSAQFRALLHIEVNSSAFIYRSVAYANVPHSSE